VRDNLVYLTGIVPMLSLRTNISQIRIYFTYS
jgi:hypothetical protein